MLDMDNMMDLFLDNVKQLFFPEEWIDLDMKFSKYELFTMLYLDKKNEITMTELVDYLNSPMSTTTGIVDRLVKRDMVIRKRSETDRRSVLLVLSPNGQELIKAFKGTLEIYINTIADDLTDEEKAFLFKIAIKILNSFKTKFVSTSDMNTPKPALKKITIE